MSIKRKRIPFIGLRLGPKTIIARISEGFEVANPIIDGIKGIVATGRDIWEGWNNHRLVQKELHTPTTFVEREKR